MELPSYFLRYEIKDTIRWITSRKCNFIIAKENMVGVYWKVLEDQDSMYDMFNNKSDMDFYYKTIKKSFEQEYPNLVLDVKYHYGPVLVDDDMYTHIIYYYYDKFYQNTKSVLVS